jgi:hypothetical protein
MQHKLAFFVRLFELPSATYKALILTINQGSPTYRVSAFLDHLKFHYAITNHKVKLQIATEQKKSENFRFKANGKIVRCKVILIENAAWALANLTLYSDVVADPTNSGIVWTCMAGGWQSFLIACRTESIATERQFFDFINDYLLG